MKNTFKLLIILVSAFISFNAISSDPFVNGKEPLFRDIENKTFILDIPTSKLIKNYRHGADTDQPSVANIDLSEMVPTEQLAQMVDGEFIDWSIISIELPYLQAEQKSALFDGCYFEASPNNSKAIEIRYAPLSRIMLSDTEYGNFTKECTSKNLRENAFLGKNKVTIKARYYAPTDESDGEITITPRSSKKSSGATAY